MKKRKFREKYKKVVEVITEKPKKKKTKKGDK